MTETITWQPIETAPKDGEYVLLWYPTHNSTGGAAAVGCWDDDRYLRKPAPFWNAYEIESLWGKKYMRQHQPTHWAPLLKGPGK